MDNVTDIRFYMDKDQLAALTANDQQRLEVEEKSISELSRMTRAVLQALENEQPSRAMAPLKTRACFEALCHYVAVQDDGNFDNAKEIVLGWLSSAEYNMDFKHQKYMEG